MPPLTNHQALKKTFLKIDDWFVLVALVLVALVLSL